MFTLFTPRRSTIVRRACVSAVLAVAAALAAATVSSASPTPTFQRVSTIGVGPIPSYGMIRVNGLLHLIYQTTAPGSAVPNGLATRWISNAGVLEPQTQALAGWTAGRPGLTWLPNGSLEAVFGAISPGPSPTSSVWGISSSDGGATWSAPADVKSGGPLESLAYGADVTAQPAGKSLVPVLTLPQAGGVVVQQGLGAGSPTQLVTDGSDNAAGDVNSAVDAASGEVVVAWQSLAGSGGTYMRGVAPTLGPAQQVPGEPRNQLVVAGRDLLSAAPGVFAAYTTDNTHVRLFRYGGGSVAVGAAPGVTAAVVGVATANDGRLWVMWGSDGGGLALTRSNKAVTKFEPIQHLDYQPSTLYRLAGDGRLGPLDLLVDEIPPATSGPVPAPGTFYARVLPVLSASVTVTAVKNKQGQVIAHTLTVHVTDAGDPVAGATVSAGGSTAKTNTAGVATLTLPGSKTGAVTLSATSVNYQQLTKSVPL